VLLDKVNAHDGGLTEIFDNIERMVHGRQLTTVNSG
jgi:hypothetical protein